MPKPTLTERLIAARQLRSPMSTWTTKSSITFPKEFETELQLKNDNGSHFDASSFNTPRIPPIGSFYDVKLARVAHPESFVVQPLATEEELKRLMLELKKLCDSFAGSTLASSEIIVGNLYAVKHDDQWYRAYVSDVIGKNIFAVYFCDYGFYKPVSLDSFQPLENQFFNLSCQAIKAKLHNVKSISEDGWSIEDSERFEELGVGESFLSIVKSYNADNFLTEKPVLSLDLIYTSTAFDISFKDVLIWEKRAI